jgi:hypothetical protein
MPSDLVGGQYAPPEVGAPPDISQGFGTRSQKVTLVWTDPTGEALQNDLGLIVRNVRDRSGTATVPQNYALDERLQN